LLRRELRERRLALRDAVWEDESPDWAKTFFLFLGGRRVRKPKGNKGEAWGKDFRGHSEFGGRVVSADFRLNVKFDPSARIGRQNWPRLDGFLWVYRIPSIRHQWWIRSTVDWELKWLRVGRNERSAVTAAERGRCRGRQESKNQDLGTDLATWAGFTGGPPRRGEKRNEIISNPRSGDRSGYLGGFHGRTAEAR
jgi:hypothetical protein